MTYHRPDSVEDTSGCGRARFLAVLARWLFPTAGTVRLQVTLYDAPPEYVSAWIAQEREANR